MSSDVEILPLAMGGSVTGGLDVMAEKAEQAAQLLSAMANPTRLLILCALVEGEKPVNDLVARTPISQSAVSQHLGKMRALGLVTTRRDGQTIYYRLASEEVSVVLSTLYALFCAKA